jgi:hypothetical protein
MPVVAAARGAVYRLNGIFGSKDVTVPLNPNHVAMEVFGAPALFVNVSQGDTDSIGCRIKMDKFG